MSGWDEEWEAARAATPRKARPAGIALLFGVVLALVVLMAVVTRWHKWHAPAPVGVRAVDLVAGPQDIESAHFELCDGPVRVSCIVDGDTLWYQRQKIRVADINAPEISHPECDYELDLGEKATRRLMALMNAGRFSLVASEERDTDKYGRKLRTLMRGGKSIGKVLVTEGLAENWIGFRRNWCH